MLGNRQRYIARLAEIDARAERLLQSLEPVIAGNVLPFRASVAVVEAALSLQALEVERWKLWGNVLHEENSTQMLQLL